MGNLFGTDGIRGVANEYPLIPEIAIAVGRAVVSSFQSNSKKTNCPFTAASTRAPERAYNISEGRP